MQPESFDASLVQKQGSQWTYDGQVIEGVGTNTPRGDVITALQSGTIPLPQERQTAHSGGGAGGAMRQSQASQEYGQAGQTQQSERTGA